MIFSRIYDALIICRELLLDFCSKTIFIQQYIKSGRHPKLAGG
jgi:hypothetical protein